MTTAPNFCPVCGSNRLTRASDENAYWCQQCNAVHYLNSKPAVCAIIIRDNDKAILLVQDWNSTGEWDLPGGFLRLGENPEDGLKRELLEELTADVEVLRLLAVRVDPYGSRGEFSLNLFYQVKLLSDRLIPANEVARFGWFSLAELPAVKYEGTAWALENLGRPYLANIAKP
jgi:ADP-ribose pyrophosphatase YjhB (NUDIX family)